MFYPSENDQTSGVQIGSGLVSQDNSNLNTINHTEDMSKAGQVMADQQQAYQDQPLGYDVRAEEIDLNNKGVLTREQIQLNKDLASIQTQQTIVVSDQT